jgi:hypothetical protein
MQVTAPTQDSKATLPIPLLFFVLNNAVLAFHPEFKCCTKTP